MLLYFCEEHATQLCTYVEMSNVFLTLVLVFAVFKPPFVQHSKYTALPLHKDRLLHTFYGNRNKIQKLLILKHFIYTHHCLLKVCLLCSCNYVHIIADPTRRAV